MTGQSVGRGDLLLISSTLNRGHCVDEHPGSRGGRRCDDDDQFSSVINQRHARFARDSAPPLPICKGSINLLEGCGRCGREAAVGFAAPVGRPDRTYRTGQRVNHEGRSVYRQSDAAVRTSRDRLSNKARDKCELSG